MGAAANGPSFEPSTDTAADHAAYTSLATNIVNYVAVKPGVRQVYWQPVCATGGTSNTTTTSTTSTVTACAAVVDHHGRKHRRRSACIARGGRKSWQRGQL